MSRKNNKYRNFPARKQIAVGERCLLVECCRQVRKAAQQFVQGNKTSMAMGFPAYVPRIEPGMVFTGVNNLTGEKESYKVTCVPWRMPDRSVVERIS